jgi:hypothetical protein
MRSQLHRVLVSAGLAASAVLAISPGAQAQVVRDHRKNPPPAEPAPVRVVVEATPREAPPPVREERFAPRPGFVFITGRWDWDRRAHKWSWIPGHWERERRGQKWRDARWELRNGEYVLVDGDWIQVDLRPTAAPPPRREERVSPRPGFVFVSGRWDWRDGNWQWINGHWERERRGQKWREARWELRNGEYVLVDGDWIQVDLRPTAAPPPPREERVAPRPGFVFVAGRWDWRDGNWQWSNGHWERERATQRWIAGRWELRGDRWEWIEGSWGAFPEYPDQPPPPPPPDEIRAQAGWVTKPGFYKWENGRYSWVRTSRLRAVPGKHYVGGEWVPRDGHWAYNEGRWVDDEPVYAPPPPRPAPAPVYTPPPAPAPPAYNGPSSPPPPPREERVDDRPGFVFVRGHYEWRDAHYEWIPGHWERSRPKLTWYDGRWEQRGNVWVYVEGGWR